MIVEAGFADECAFPGEVTPFSTSASGFSSATTLRPLYRSRHCESEERRRIFRMIALETLRRAAQTMTRYIAALYRRDWGGGIQLQQLYKCETYGRSYWTFKPERNSFGEI
jgi:hypothetical protein